MEIIVSRLLVSTAVVSFLLLCLSLWLNRGVFHNILRNISGRYLLVLLGIILLGTALNFGLSPRIYYDIGNGADYLDMARNILETGSVEKIDYKYGNNGTSPYPPVGWGFMVALSFLLFGTSVASGILMSGILTTLSIPFMFMLSFILFRNIRVSLLSSFIYSIVPGIILFSGTMQPNASSLLFVHLAFFSFYVFFEKKDFCSFLFFASAFSFMLLYRIEFLAFAPVFLIMVAIHNKEAPLGLIKKNPLIPLLFLALTLPQFINAAIRATTGPLMSYSLDTVALNFSVWLLPFFTFGAHPLALSALALVGMASILFSSDSEKRGIMTMSVYVVLMSAFFLFPYIVILRMLLVLYIPLCILASFATVCLSRSFRKWKDLSMAIISVSLSVSFVPYLAGLPQDCCTMGFINDDYYYQNSLQTEMEINLSKSNQVPSECVLLAGKPAVFRYIEGTRTGVISFFDTGALEGNCTVILKDWCYYTDESTCGDSRAIIDNILSAYETDKLDSFESYGLEYALYRIIWNETANLS